MQDGLSVTEAKKKNVKNFTYDEKKRFAFCTFRHPQRQKNAPSTKTIRDHLQN